MNRGQELRKRILSWYAGFLPFYFFFFFLMFFLFDAPGTITPFRVFLVTVYSLFILYSVIPFVLSLVLAKRFPRFSLWLAILPIAVACLDYLTLFLSFKK